MSIESADTSPLSSGQGSVPTLADFGDTPEGKAKRWKAELDTSRRSRKNWVRKAEKVIKRYRDERDSVDQQDRKFNVLWSNISVMKPAIYAKPPKPEVSRKFDTESDINRVAATIMERNLEYFVCEHGTFDAVMSQCVQDRLLPGQGTAWIRYSANLPPPPPDHKEPAVDASTEEYAAHEKTETPQQEGGEHANLQVTDDTYEAPTEETVCYDYVHWKDFRTSPARTWEEVTWVARRVFMTQAQGIKRFGKEFKDVPLNYREQDTQEAKSGGNREFGPGPGVLQKAAIWEIWDKDQKQVVWMCEDYAKILDEKRDLLELRDFFPCPKPLLATITNDSIIPIPDYVMYQDQAMELDQATNRISMLMQALKVIGVYDKTQDAVSRLLTEGVDNVMIPVDNWAMFAERGGIKGTVDFFPVELVSQVLTQLIQDRNTIKQDIYEITGIADIVRGATVASETATAQQLKAKFAGIRINDSQKDIARFAADLMNMSAEIMTNFFQPETLVIGADLEDQQNPDFQYVPGAIQLIKNGALVKHRMTVSVDAITEADKEEQQQKRSEFLVALGQFMQQASQAVAEHPELAQMMGHITLWGVRGFEVGRDLEGVIEQGIKAIAAAPPQQKPDPAMQKVQGEMQMMQAKAQQDGQAMQMEMQMKQQDAQARQAESQQKMQIEMEKMKMEMAKSQMEMKMKQEELMAKLDYMKQESAMKLSVMEQELALKLQVAQMEGGIKIQQAQTDAQIKQDAAAQDANMQQEQHAMELAQGAQTHEATMEQQAEAADASIEQKETAAKQKAEGEKNAKRKP